MPAKKAWYECLESYSQVELFSRKSTASVASDAMKACAEEREAYQLKLLRELTTRNASNQQSVAMILAVEDSAAARHTLMFVNRYRLK